MNPAFFDNETGNGSILVTSLPGIDATVNRETLTDAEVDERTSWLERRHTLLTHYKSSTRGALATAADFLQQRVAPPPLINTANGISRRESLGDTKAERRHGPEMKIWEDFERLADEYSRETVGDFSETLLLSLKKRGKLYSEQEEQTYFQKTVLTPLESAQLLEYGATCRGTTGEDITLTTTNAEGVGTATAVVEFKSTHDLLLPAAVADVVTLFNQYCTTARTEETIANSTAGRVWTRIGHPVGQVVGYMENKQVTFGAVSSGTRTFFLCLKPHSDLQISGPWLVGQPGYLKAWAYFANEAEQSTKNGDGGGSGNQRRPAKKQKKEEKTKETKSRSTNTQGTVAAIPLVSCHDIERVKPLGHGRNGTVYLGLWQEQYVAIKQFDVSKSGGRHYERELAAYMHLHSAWGLLVPRPLFRCEHFPYSYLGIQLGRKPDENDDVSASWRRVLRALEAEHNFRHLDVDEHDGNMIFIQAEDKSEHLVAIDLETYEILE
jgi:hypothetical protein